MNEIKRDSIEILAPAGSIESLYAALKSGADAVYLGITNYGARAFANNFDMENVEQAIQLCKERNVKVYITFNTLIYDKEFIDIIEKAVKLYEFGADAFIVQDIGLAVTLKTIFSDIDIHASTQMTIYNSLGAEFLKNYGFSRVILAREITLEELELISNTVDIEKEIFIHGSLCICLSGQCLMSSFLGGRSGNRGKCAQPCRKTYSVLDRNGNCIDKLSKKTILSPKDLALTYDLNVLRKLKIDSVKIEGRMKKPEYVYQVVKSYVKLLKDETIDENLLSEVSNRNFTKGFLFNLKSKDYIDLDSDKTKIGSTVGVAIEIKSKKAIKFIKPVNKGDTLHLKNERNRFYQITLTQNYEENQILTDEKISDLLLNSKILRLYNESIRDELLKTKLSMPDTYKVNLKFTGKVNFSAKLEAIYQNNIFEVYSKSILQKAKSSPVSEENIKNQILKFPQNYEIGKFDIEIDENIFIPLKELNQMRRDILTQIKLFLGQIRTTVKSENQEIFTFCSKNEIKTHKLKINLEISNSEWIEFIDFKEYPDRIIVNNLEYIEKLPLGNIFYQIPNLLSTIQYESLLRKILKKIDRISGFLINNYGDYQFLLENNINKNVWCGEGLNICNSQSLKFWDSLNIKGVELSSEIGIKEINEMNIPKNMETDYFFYGNTKLMTLKYCPISPILNCNLSESSCKNCKYKGLHFLQDEKNKKFPFKRFENYTEIYNSVKTNLFSNIKELSNSNITTIRFRILDKKDVDIYNEYISKYEKMNSNFFYNGTKGHFLKSAD